MSEPKTKTAAQRRTPTMDPSTGQTFRFLCIAEMKRLNDRMQEFCDEVRRQEDVLRQLYPALAGAFRMSHAKAPGANDNRLSVKPRPHP